MEMHHSPRTVPESFHHVQRLDMVDAELDGLNGQRVPEPIAHHGEQQQSEQQQQHLQENNNNNLKTIGL